MPFVILESHNENVAREATTPSASPAILCTIEEVTDV